MSNSVETATREHVFAEKQKRIEELEAENAKLKETLSQLQDSQRRADRKAPPPGTYM